MTESATLNVTGMKCSGCENNVSTKLKSLPGILAVEASSKDKRVNVEFNPDQVDLNTIAAAISEIGYTVVEE